MIIVHRGEVRSDEAERAGSRHRALDSGVIILAEPSEASSVSHRQEWKVSE